MDPTQQKDEGIDGVRMKVKVTRKQICVPCPNCGFAIPIGATWCEGCGAGNVPVAPSQRVSRPTILLLILTLFVIPMTAFGSCIQNSQVADISVIVIIVSILAGFGILVSSTFRKQT